MLKKCTKCYNEQDLDNFAFINKKANIRRAMCDDCVGELTSKHYLENKESYRVSQRNRRDRNREFVKNYLKDKSCIDCGNDDWRVLEFDHVRGTKSFNISQMIVNRSPIAKIEIEISKCDIRCANCHKIVTHERQGNYRAK